MVMDPPLLAAWGKRWRRLCTWLLLLHFGLCNARIRNLQAQGNFKSVVLTWERQSENPSQSNGEVVFRVRLCENQAWGPEACRYFLTTPMTLVKTADDGVGGHEAYSFEIKGLRMATSYTINVTEEDDDVMRESEPSAATRQQRRFESNTVVNTKGFSAKATACNSTTTQMHLDTGPNFGGRISLEGLADGHEENSDCTYFGDPNSETTSVIFTIDHNKCSGVHQINNGTGVKVYVVVQESLPILTHSTRRFLVVCNFKPSAFTVQTGLNMPPSELRSISDVLSFRSTRIQHHENAPGASSTLAEEASPRSFDLEMSNNVGHIVRLKVPKRNYYYKTPREEEISSTTSFPSTLKFHTDETSQATEKKGNTESTLVSLEVVTKADEDMTPASTSAVFVNGDQDRDGMPWYPSDPLPILQERHPKSFHSHDELDEDYNSELTTQRPTLDPNKEEEDEEDALKASAGARWFLSPEGQGQPVSHIVLMIVLVVSATVGSIATLYWSVVTCRRRKGPENSEATDPGSPSSIPRLTSVCHTAATMSRSGRPNQDASGEYEYVGNPQLQPPKSLNPKIESFA